MPAQQPAVDPRPMALGSGDRAVLLLHGLTGTPYDVEPVAAALAEHGFAVRVPLLAGHTDLDALERSTRDDWYHSAAEALRSLRQRDRAQVVVLGFSMGGLLALRLAAEVPQDVAGVVACSVMLDLPAWKRAAADALAGLRRLPVVGRAVGMFPKRDGPDVRVAQEAHDSPSLRAFPYSSLVELTQLQREVGELLPRIRAPMLIVHGQLDHTAPLHHSERLAQQVGSSRVERLLLPRSFHIVARDLDRDLFADRVRAFVVSVLGDPSADRTAKPGPA